MFNLSEKLKKVKDKLKPIENDVILISVIILVALISFGLGRLSKIRENKTPITIEGVSQNASDTKVGEAGGSAANQQAAITGSQTEKVYVASKNGTKYHYPWCPGALNIKEENKIWFSSKEQAESAGYSPAGNCKGL